MNKLISRIFLVITLLSSFNMQAQKPDYTLADVWQKYTFYPRNVYGIRSMNDGNHYTTLENNSIKQFSYKTGKLVKTVFSFDMVKGQKTFKISDYEFNHNESQILLSTAVEPIYRHSFRAEYYLYDVASKTLTFLSKNGKQQLLHFSPDGKKVAFVKENNLYYMNLSDMKEIAVTTDGKKNAIINGAPDWVYEEEFSFSKAYEWSPESNQLAFLRFDESKVKEYNMPIYNGLYPEQYRFKYPKAGETNSTVTLNVYQLDKKSSKKVNLDNGYEYIPRIKWTKTANTLSVQTLNRQQNDFQLFFYNTQTGNTQLIYQDKNDTYNEIYDILTFTNDGKYFIINSEKTGYNHLYLYDMKGKEVRQITKGNWEVIDLKGYDAAKKMLYYISTETSPTQRMLYQVKIDGKHKKLLSEKKGVNTVAFSKSFKYYINTWSSAAHPYEVALYSGKGKKIRELLNNNAMFSTLNKFNWSPKEFFTIKNEEGTPLNAWMIKPANFDENKKYPVYMMVYGGPGQQTVMDRWSYDALWHNFLAQKGFIVVSVDSRGTDGRGYRFKRSTYGQMGKLESKDQADAAKYLGSLPYVDASRIAIQGWSYGGYMSTLCLEKYPEVFKAAVAVAPVTNWRYYDSVYSERYLGMPDENPDGFDANSPTNSELIKQMKGKYLLIHGSADDNVHMQNAFELTKKLIQADVDFEQFIYPNKNHGIYGGNTRYHLFKKIYKFIKTNL